MDAIRRSHFFSAVYIVQLLDPADTNKTGSALSTTIQPLALAQGIDPQFIDLHSNSELLPALAAIETRCQQRKDSPIIHIESHGSVTGIGRRSDPLIAYDALKEPLTAINRVSRGNLLVTMAACFGASLVSVFVHSTRMPVWALLGPTTLALPSDIERGFQAFYHALLTTLDLNTALSSLRAADHTLPESWYFQPAETLFAIGYGLHAARFRGPGGRRHAERTILKKTRRNDRRAGRVRPRLRQAIRRSLSQPPGEWFADLKARFFMADLFPENVARFPITQQECDHLFTLWQANPNRGAA
jgi:hypothetical protein